MNKFCSDLSIRVENSSINTFEEFDDIFQSSVDNTCKLSVPKTTKRNSITNPWITPGLIKSIDKKDKLYKIWKKSCKNKNKTGNAEYYENYKNYRRELTNLIKRQKQQYYYKQFDKNKSDKKKTWAVINKLRGKVKNSIKSSFLIDNERIICRRIIANKFNDYFVSLARNQNTDAYGDNPITELPSFHSYLSKPCDTSIFMEDCNNDEINEIIGELENGKSSDIPIILIKKSAPIISPVMVALYNKHIALGCFPKPLKIGKITPIHKKGNKELIENYRPVSTLPIFGKIFEKIIYKRLYKFFASKGILSESQFGFRKGHSTSHAVHHSVNIIKEAHKNKKHVIGVFIDLSKAFDTLDHKIMLEKLYNCGVRGVAHNLIASYLADRQQYTCVLGENSELQDVEFGVPQGSVLGPLLFLLYINDLLNCYKGTDCKFVLYADDTNLFIIDVSREAAIEKANKILRSVNNFMKSNLLHINLGKCCYMHFEPPSNYKTQTNSSCARTSIYVRKQDTTKLKLNEFTIEEVSETKFLGVIIDNRLSWIPHIENLHKKLKLATGVLSRIKHNIPTENLKSIYHALFESHMTYCITVFGGVSNVHLEKLFRTQKHCIRILFGDFEAHMQKYETCARTRVYGKQILGSEFYCKEHTKPLFQQHELMAFQNIYNYQVCLEMLKIIKFRLPISLYSSLELSQRNNSTTLILPPPSDHFIYRASKMWNIVVKIMAKDVDILSIKIGSFKKELKSVLLGIQNKFDATEWYPYNFRLETGLKTSKLNN